MWKFQIRSAKSWMDSWLFILRANISHTWKQAPSDAGNLFWTLREECMFEKVFGWCENFTNLIDLRWGYKGSVISSSPVPLPPFLSTYRFPSVLGMKTELQKWAGSTKQSGPECTKQKQLISGKISPMFWEPEKAGARASSANFYWPQRKKVKDKEETLSQNFHLANVLDSYGCFNVFSQTVAQNTYFTAL